MLQLLTRMRHGEPLRARAVFRDAFRSLVRVFLPQNLPLLLYGIALIPLTNFFLAANHLTQFAVPEYLWGLLKARPGNRLLFALAVLCVLALLLEGKDNQNIASALTLSLGTVKAHVHNILKKTDHASRQDLTRDFWKE